MSNVNIEMIQNVAHALSQIDEEFVFVGGASVSLYLDLDIADDVRPTEDVDVIIKIASKAKYSLLSEKLAKAKFTPDTSKGAPIVRWKYLGTTIDIMPLDEDILGFSNQYYKDGFENREQYTLPNGTQIFILPLAYFLATKQEAYFNRGVKEPRFSKDLEDIVALLSDAKDFSKAYEHQSLLADLKTGFQKIFDTPESNEAIRGMLQGTPKGQYDLILKRSKLD